MQCSICKKKLVKTFSEGVYVQRCPQCNGIWFPKDTIFEFLKLSTNDSTEDDRPPEIQNPKKEQGFCPHCQKLMELYTVDVNTNINRCMECGGLFVGIAELGRIEYLYCQDYWKKISVDLTPSLYKEHEFISRGSIIKGFFGLIEDENPRKHFPWATLCIIIVNVVMLILAFSDPESALSLCLIPQQFLNNPVANSPLIFTAMFSHAGLAHLFWNMYFLWVFSDNLEDILGSVKYFILYILFGVVSEVTYSILTGNPQIPTLGASGAVSGIMGGYLYLFPKGRLKIFTLIFFQGIKFNLPIWFYLGIWFVGMQTLSIYFGVPGVAWWAHLSGFIAGFLALLVLKKSGNL